MVTSDEIDGEIDVGMDQYRLIPTVPTNSKGSYPRVTAMITCRDSIQQ